VLLGAHGDCEVWVADFGVADLFASERACGELGWLPVTPEQSSGGATATSEDIYLLGCLAYWMLAGRPVFTAEDLATLRRRHAIEDPPALGHSSGRKLPASLALAIARALEKDPDDRFADFDAFEAMLVRAEIESGIDGRAHTVASRPLPPTPAPTRPPVRRVPPLLWSAVGALAVGLPLLWSNLTTVPVEMKSLPAVVITAGVAPEPCAPEPLPPVPGPLPAADELAPASFEPMFAERDEPTPLITDEAALVLASDGTNMGTPSEPTVIVERGEDITFFETEGAAGRERGSGHPARERGAELSSAACVQVRRDALAARETHDWPTLLRATSRAGCWRSIRARGKLRIKALMELKRFDECAEAAVRSDHHDAEVARWGEICKRRTAATG
jgi:hypothetical protein